MSSKIGQRFVKRQSQFKARGGYKKRATRTTINQIVKRALNNTGVSSRYLASQAPSKELGYVDTPTNGLTADYAFDTTGSVTLLNTVAQGASTLQRVGKKIRMTSLQCRGLIFQNATATINDPMLMIVYDKRPTGAAPAITDILRVANSSSMNNDDNVPHRFMILKRWNMTMSGNSATPATGQEIKNADFYLPCRLPVVYKSAGTGAIGDIEEGALWLVTVGANAAGTTAATLRGTFRLRFIDI